MMLLRLCPIRAQEGCRKKDCYLTDRTGQKFPLVCSGEYTELCNAKLLWLADKQRQLRYLDYWDFYFTQETPAQLKAVLADYENGSHSVPHDRTNGLYFKGGLV
jgi:putative protease